MAATGDHILMPKRLICTCAAIGMATVAIRTTASGPATECRTAAHESEAAARTRYAYFNSLISRPDCLAAFSLRDRAELEHLPTGGKSEKKQPITYDPEMDAARITIAARVSTDSQQKLLPIQAHAGSLLITWDFRFDRNFTR